MFCYNIVPWRNKDALPLRINGSEINEEMENGVEIRLSHHPRLFYYFDDYYDAAASISSTVCCLSMVTLRMALDAPRRTLNASSVEAAHRCIVESSAQPPKKKQSRIHIADSACSKGRASSTSRTVLSLNSKAA